VILRTFSKAYGLAGLRLGYAVADPRLISRLQNIRSPFNINTAAIVAGEAALRDREYVESYVSQIRGNREWLRGELERSGIRTYPSQANFILADFGDKADFLYAQLRAGQILLRKKFEEPDFPLLKTCLRIGIGTRSQCAWLLDQIRFLLDQRELFQTKGYAIPQNLIELRKTNGMWR